MRIRCIVRRASTVLAAAVFLMAAEAWGGGKSTAEGELDRLSAKEMAAMELRAGGARELYFQGEYASAAEVFRELAGPMTQSQSLYQCELALCLLAEGKKDEARELLLAAYHSVQEFFDPRSEKKAASLWGSETKKVYKGDPYEQATLCLVLGLLFLDEGDVDNALACFKSGQLADSDTSEEEFKADYALLQFLEAVCYRLRDQRDRSEESVQEGIESFIGTAPEGQSAGHADCLVFPANVLLFLMSGQAPGMIRAGEYGETRLISVPEQAVDRYEVLLDGETWVDPVQGVGDVVFQATTRGGREMDNVLRKQAQTKRVTDQTGNQLIDSGGDVGGYAGLAMMGIGLVLKGVSAAVTAEADIRCWRTLPASIQPLFLHLPPGDHQLKINAFRNYEYVGTSDVGLPVRDDSTNIFFLFPTPTGG